MRNKRNRLGALLLALLLCLTNAAFAAAEVDAAPLTTRSAARSGMVRVYLSSLGSPTRLDITVAGSYSINGNTAMALASGSAVSVSFNQSNGHITVTRNGASTDMGTEVAFRRHATSGANGLKIAQAKKSGNLYPGDLYLTAQSTSSGYKLYAIVHVYIEYYLYGVVPYEMGDSANIEALKAQAVAARTYTLRRMEQRASSLYDVVDTTNDQVYYGASSTTANCTAAVDATRGIVLTNGGALTQCYYTASNGGQTESAKNMWGSTSLTYLTVKDDPFDLGNSASSVKSMTVYAAFQAQGQNASLQTLLTSKAAAAISSAGYKSGSIQSITAVTPHTPKFASPSRLYTKMDFTVLCSVQNSAGTWVNARFVLTCDIFTELESRLALSINGSANELWSVERTADGWTIRARRYGHGVGMSQRGAMQMGRLGYTYDQILGFYYEDSVRVRYTFTHTILSAVSDEGGDTLTETEDAAELTQSAGTPAVVRLVNMGDRLAIRQTAEAGGKILTSVLNGAAVGVLARGDSWCLIRYGQIVGYVQTASLTISGTAAAESAESATQVSQYATVNCTGTLNLRDSASTSGKVITTIPSGAVLPVFDRSGAWAHVQYGAYAGYAMESFLAFSDTYPTAVTDPGSETALVTTEDGAGAVLRASASTTGQTLAQLSEGTTVAVTRNDGSWCSVTVNGLTGYLRTDDLTFSGEKVETPTTPPTAADTSEAVVKSTTETAPLYAEANEQSAVSAYIPRGESIVVTAKGDTWCTVKYGELTGFVRTELLMFPSDTAEVTAYATVTTVSGSLNLRSKASAGSTILRTIPRLARVGVIARDSVWTQVTYSGTSGYVMTTFLTFEGDAAAPQSGNAVVTTPSGGLNLREGMSTATRVLLTLNAGERVTASPSSDTWSRVEARGVTGYAMTQFLTYDTPATETPTATPAPTEQPTETPQSTEPTPENTASTPEASPEPLPTPAADPTSAPSGASTYRVVTGGGSLNLRAWAGTAAAILARIPENAEVSVLESGAIWSRVRYGTLDGYVMTKYLSANSGVVGGSTATVVTASGSLNLRVSPSASAGVAARIPRYATVTVNESGTTWCHVTWGSVSGYAMTAFLRFDGASPTSAPTFIPTQMPAAEEPATAYVSTPSGSLNLRESASASARVIGSIPKGATVAVTTYGADWCAVRYQTKNGYVMTKYLTLTVTGAPATATSVPAPTEAPQSKTMIVVTGGGHLNLRQTPSSGGTVLAAIPEYAQVTWHGTENGWSSVTYGSLSGYVMARYLSDPSAQSTAAPSAEAPAATEAPAAPTEAPTATEAPAATEAPVYDATLAEAELDETALVVSVGTLNLRAWCSTTAPVLSQIASGTVVTVTEVGQTWCHVYDEKSDTDGYCKTEFLVLSEAQ